MSHDVGGARDSGGDESVDASASLTVRAGGSEGGSGTPGESGAGDGGGTESPGGAGGRAGTGDTGLGPLILARGTVDRSSGRRSDENWLAAAWDSQGSRVLVLDGAQTLVRFGDSEASLVFVSPQEAPEGPRFLLGADDGGTVYFAVAGPSGGLGAGPLPPPGSSPPPGGAGVRPAGLRQAAPLLSDRDAGLLTHAVALANWHASHTHCPRCGTPTKPVPGGHARRCPADGSEHFPRVDPAVIMLVTDDSDRCLLARNRNWPPRRVSILAGFVEPGESVEAALVREVHEETGLRATSPRYLGSQPWPMPQSLMLGFRAHAPGDQRIQVDEDEIAEAGWYSRDGLRAAMASGDILLPPPVSIAHRILESWYGDSLPGSW